MSGQQLHAIAQLGNLLPPELSLNFQEALNQLSQLLHQSVTIDVEDGDGNDMDLIGEDGYMGGPTTPAPPHFGSPSSPTSTIPGSVSASTLSPGTAGSFASGPLARGRVPDCKLEASSNRSRSRAESADSGVRRRLRSKQPRPEASHTRMRSESPTDPSLLTGPSYFPPAALATDFGVGIAAA